MNVENARHMQRETIYPVGGNITFKMKDDFKKYSIPQSGAAVEIYIFLLASTLSAWRPISDIGGGASLQPTSRGCTIIIIILLLSAEG